MAKRHDELNINPPSFCKELSNMNKEIKVNVYECHPARDIKLQFLAIGPHGNSPFPEFTDSVIIMMGEDIQ